jgi:hypothetical protein
MTGEMTRIFPFDHAGIGETSLLMAFCPEGVDTERLSEEKWYTRSASGASPELGAEGRQMIRNHLRQVLKPVT